MKKILFVLTCLLLVSACGRQAEAPPGATDCGGGPPNRIDEQFESIDELLDFVAAIDPKTYPEGYSEQHSGPVGDLEPLVSALQQDGYLLLLRSDDPGPAEQEPRYVVSSMDSHFGEMYQAYDTYVGEWLLCLEVSAIPEALWDKAEQGVLEYAEASRARVVYPDTWEKSGAYVNAYLDEVTVNGEKVPCLVNIPVRSAPRIHFVWEHKAITVGFVPQTEQAENPESLDLSPMEKLTLEKVPLPDAEEARARMAQREKEAAAREEAALAEAAAETAEALRGPAAADAPEKEEQNESTPIWKPRSFENTDVMADWVAATDAISETTPGYTTLLTRIQGDGGIWVSSCDGHEIASEDLGEGYTLPVVLLPQEQGYLYRLLIDGRLLVVILSYMEESLEAEPLGSYLEYRMKLNDLESMEEAAFRLEDFHEGAGIEKVYTQELSCGGTTQLCDLWEDDQGISDLFYLSPPFIVHLRMSADFLEADDGYDILEKLTLEKVPLPDAEEARARVEQREKEAAAREEAALAEAAAETAEALRGQPKADSR